MILPCVIPKNLLNAGFFKTGCNSFQYSAASINRDIVRRSQDHVGQARVLQVEVRVNRFHDPKFIRVHGTKTHACNSDRGLLSSGPVCPPGQHKEKVLKMRGPFKMRDSVLITTRNLTRSEKPVAALKAKRVYPHIHTQRFADLEFPETIAICPYDSAG